MAGDATFGGTALWAINNAGGGGSLSTGGNPYNLTKVGLAFAQNAVAWNKYFAFHGNGTTTTVNNGVGANTELAGPVELSSMSAARQ
jgi:hypothetical protein